MKRMATVVILAIIMTFLFWNETFYPIENNLKDRLTNETRTGNPDILILGIDSESLNQVGQWPWSRDILANLSEELIQGGAEAVWLDVLYTEESTDKESNKVWNEVVQKYENLYLSAYFDFQTKQDVREGLQYTNVNLPVYQIPMEQIVHINTLEDADRVVRKALLGVPMASNEMMLAAGVQLANHVLPDSEQITWDGEQWLRGEQVLPANELNQVQFKYASSPQESTIEVLPIHRFIEGEIPPAYYKNKLILIGPYAVAMNDYYQTPMSTKVQMNGVEIHANITQSLIENNIYQDLAKPAAAGIIIAFAFIAFYTANRLRQLWAIIVTLVLIVAYVLAFILLYDIKHVTMPFIYPLLTIVFAYIASIVFNYLEEQKEKRRVTDIFGRYVSQSVVNELLATGEGIKVGGERKEVTLMFVDIRGFTPLSEKMEPEEVIEILNEYLELCTQAVFEYGGTIDKFMGDGVMVIFGAPVAQEDHALRAAKTALRLQEKAAGLARRLEEQYGRTIAFGVGLNSGPAVVGNIGSKDRVDYTAIGDTVNLAARLESNAKPNQVLISETVFEAIRAEISCTKLEPIKVKGKEKTVQVYELNGRKSI